MNGKNFSPEECFRRALSYLLEKEGWGSETTLSFETGISQAHINKIKQGVAGGSVKALHKIAAGLGTTYPAMLELGRQLQEGHQDLRIPLQAIRKPAADLDGEVVLESPLLSIHSDSPNRPPAGDAHIESLINDVRAILASGNAAAIEALVRSIACFKQTVENERRMLGMDQRLQQVEKRLRAAAGRIREADDHAKKDRILKKRVM